MERDALLDRARGRGVNPLVYWGLRAILQPFFHLYWRLSRIGREHIPATGPFIIAANHRSFLDPFVIAVMARRPIYFMTKKEAFINRPVAWLLSSLGAYPIDREGGDQEAMDTTKAILARGEFISERVGRVTRHSWTDAQAHDTQRKPRLLTSREREVLQLLAEGRANKEVATTLSISTKTAETHRSRIMAKLEMHSMSELVRYAIRNHIIEA